MDRGCRRCKATETGTGLGVPESIIGSSRDLEKAGRDRVLSVNQVKSGKPKCLLALGHPGQEGLQGAVPFQLLLATSSPPRPRGPEWYRLAGAFRSSRVENRL